MGVTSPNPTRQPLVAIAPDKAATFEADTTLRSLTTSLQHTPTVQLQFIRSKVAVISFFDTGTCYPPHDAWHRGDRSRDLVGLDDVSPMISIHSVNHHLWKNPLTRI